MSNLNDLLNLLPLDQIAGKLGVDGDTARAAVATALPSLVAGMQNNAASPEGAEALQSAIQQHDAALLDNGVNIDAVDIDDGQKIVDHVLGENQEALASQLSNAAPAGIDLGDLVKKALPMLAPIVMSFLAKNSANASAAAPTEGGLDIGGMLGGLLGGGGQQGGGLDLGGMLGGLLGGGGQQQAGGGLDIGGMLGGLLGGGQQQAEQPKAGGGLDLGGILGGLFGNK